MRRCESQVLKEETSDLHEESNTDDVEDSYSSEINEGIENLEQSKGRTRRKPVWLAVL